MPRAFRELRRISLAGNMITDHTSKAYYEALLECKYIRRSPNELPKWTGFDEESTWYVLRSFLELIQSLNSRFC